MSWLHLSTSAILPHSAPSWIPILRIWQVSACKMEWHYSLVWTAKLFLSMLCGVPNPKGMCGVHTLIRYERCPHLNKVCAVSPHFQYMFFLCGVPPHFHTWLCLVFLAKLRIWQVPACKMMPQIGFYVLLSPSPN